MSTVYDALLGLSGTDGSNTKIHIYLDALESSPTCRQIIQYTPKPNAVTTMQDMDPESTCELAKAGDIVTMLEEGLVESGKVHKIRAEATVLERKGVSVLYRYTGCITDNQDAWNVSIKNDETALTASTLILATGAYPQTANFHEKHNPKVKVVDLDTSLRRSVLPSIFSDSSSSPPQIAIIGNSHSAILVVRNLYDLAQSKVPGLKVKLFERRPLVFAEYRDEGIVHDNTGLKGTAAEWAKETLESGKAADVVDRIHLPTDEQGADQVYAQHLPSATHLVYAIGYVRSPVPHIILNGKRVDDDIVFDMHTSGFHFDRENKSTNPVKKDDLIPGLFGCGIAFPEEVADPEGNVEAAVGVAKFFKFAERVKADWVTPN